MRRRGRTRHPRYRECQLSDAKAPYVYANRDRNRNPRWRFRRKGYCCPLPVGHGEPWFSRAYLEALGQSGLSAPATYTVLRQIPNTLAAALHCWRLLGRTSGARSHTERLAADDLMCAFGWMDVRAITPDLVQTMAGSGRGSIQRARVLRTVVPGLTPCRSARTGKMIEDRWQEFLEGLTPQHSETSLSSPIRKLA